MVNNWQQQETQNLDLFDAIAAASFILQLQNRESHQIDQIRDELRDKIDSQTKVLLNNIEAKLDTIIYQLNDLSARVDRLSDFY